MSLKHNFVSRCCVLLILCINGGIQLEVKAQDVFSTGNKAATSVKWRGEHLIVKDELSIFSDNTFNTIAKDVKVINRNENKIVNTSGEYKKYPFRKEVGLLKNAAEIEMNIQFSQPAYSELEDVPTISYVFYVPVKTLINMEWKAIVGRGHKKQEVRTGKISKATPDGNIIGGGTRWIAFKGKDKNIVFDLNPDGVQGFGDYGPLTVQGLWSIVKEGEFLIFGFGRGSTFFGGVYNSKVVIFEGSHADYSKRHARNEYRYYSEIPITELFCFGAVKYGKKYSPVYNIKNHDGWGWQSGENLQIVNSGKDGALYSHTYSNKADSLKIPIERPGLYMITMQSSAFNGNLGKFNITANGETKAADVEVSQGTVKRIIWPQWIDGNSFELKLEGDWAISTLGLQLLHHTKEDFSIRRGFWLLDDEWTPTQINANIYKNDKINYKTAISEIKIPESDEDIKEIYKFKEQKAELPDQMSDDMAWRFNTLLGTMGPSNQGTFLEFPTVEIITKRLMELNSQGVKTIILNGFLARHIHYPHRERVKNNVKVICDIAHKMDMKVIDHRDLTLLWNVEYGYRYMIKHSDWLLNTIKEGLPTTGLCLSNPEFRKEFYSSVKDFIKSTNIDGMMVDETTFHSALFCGCTHCRKAFKKTTDIDLPISENSPLLYAKKSNLWSSCQEWRRRQVVDFWLNLRREIKSSKENFTLMKYTTHYGFQGVWASMHLGIDLAQVAKTCDFVGTEIMSRNVMASNRAVFTLRKMKNSLREAYGSPIFGLVYPLASNDFAYFGWAMNNMHAQNTWMIAGSLGPDAGRKYTGWKNNMNHRVARPAAEIAVLMPMQSRDWGRKLPSTGEVLGIAQALADRNISHTFIIEPSLNIEKLRQYKMLILGSASCLSDRQIETILEYVRGGGTVYASGHAGTQNEFGELRTSWSLGDAIGINASLEIEFYNKQSTLKSNMSEGKVVFPSVIRKFEIADTKRTRELLSIIEKETGSYPAAVKATYGKGKFIYSAPQFGIVNFESETTCNKEWKYIFNKECDSLFGELINETISFQPKFKPVSIPEKILSTVYRERKDDKDYTLVHLLNATGVNNKVGEIIKNTAGELPWPIINSDIIFDIRSEKLKSAYIVSPDYSEQHKVDFQKIDKNYYRIKIPGYHLKSYFIVYMEELTTDYTDRHGNN
ncbi:MAG: hypothetical protein ACYTFY_12025 [Planctomycetota bacterium]|jgi:hypothetical protein